MHVLTFDGCFRDWPTVSTDHTHRSPEPEVAPGSAVESETQERKPDPDEEQTKIATPEMEKFLVRRMNHLYKWAEETKDEDVLQWFDTEVRGPDLIANGFRHMISLDSITAQEHGVSPSHLSLGIQVDRIVPLRHRQLGLQQSPL